MSVLTFKIHDVKKLIEELDAASSFSPSTDDLFNPEMYSDGIVRDKNGRTEQEAEKHGGMFWPSEDFIDQSKVKPALILVGDHGVYLITMGLQALAEQSLMLRAVIQGSMMISTKINATCLVVMMVRFASLLNGPGGLSRTRRRFGSN